MAASLPSTTARAGVAAAGRWPLASPCRYVVGGGGSGGAANRGGRSPTAAPPAPNFGDALARFADARLAAREAVDYCARMANDPDEAVAELVCRLASSPRAHDGAAYAAARQRRRRRVASPARQPAPSASLLLATWAAPVAAFEAFGRERRAKAQALAQAQAPPPPPPLDVRSQ